MDSGFAMQGGSGGTDTTASGGAPSNGGTTENTGGAVAVTGDGGAVASGGVTAGGGTATGGSSATSGGATNDAGSVGAGGGCTTGQKSCSGACVVESAMNGCSAMSCAACPIPAPANGLQLCDDQGQCDFECLSGFHKNGNQCATGDGSGGTSGSGGAGGAGGELTCGTRTCKSCLGNLVSCCTKDGKLCQCVLKNATNLCQ